MNFEDPVLFLRLKISCSRKREKKRKEKGREIKLGKQWAASGLRVFSAERPVNSGQTERFTS